MSVLGYAVVCADDNSFTWWGDDAVADGEGQYPGARVLSLGEAIAGFKEAKSYNTRNEHQFKLVEIREVEV